MCVSRQRTDLRDYRRLGITLLIMAASFCSNRVLGAQTNYSAWASSWSLSAPAPADDPDHDRILNLFEFALGKNPIIADGGELMRVTADGIEAIMTYNPDAGATGVQIIPQWSSNLLIWQDVPAGQITILPGGAHEVRQRHGGTGYFRLAVGFTNSFGPAGVLPYSERMDTELKGRWQSSNHRNPATGIAAWSSGPIPITGYHELTISLDYMQGGANKLEADDTLRVWYETNGVPVSPNLVSVNGEFPTGRSTTLVSLSDVTIELKAESLTSASTELHFLDRIQVESLPVGAVVPPPSPMPAYTLPPAPPAAPPSSGVIPYATTPRFSASTSYAVKVNDVRILVDQKFEPLESPVLDPGAEDYQLAIARLTFDFAQNPTASIEIDISGAGQNVTTHTISPRNPSAFNISGEPEYYTNVSATGSKLRFDLSSARNMLIKINNLHYLVLLVDPPETNPPKPGQTNVINLASYVNPTRDRNGDVTAQFQQALDDTSALGGPGILCVPDDLYMTGQLVIKSNTHLYLSSGAMIQAIPAWNRALYPDQHDGDSSLIFIGNNNVTLQNLATTHVQKVKITGRGHIDGNGWKMRYDNDTLFTTANVKLLRAANADIVTVEGIYFRDSARWSFNPILSGNVTFRDVKLINNVVGYFDSSAGQGGFHIPYVSNTDGFDIDSCTNVTVVNAFIFTGDDAFTPKTASYMDLAGTCSQLTFTNNVMWTQKAALKIGDETDHDIFGVRFEGNHVIRADRLVSVLSEAANNVSLHDVAVRSNRTEFLGGNAKQRFFHFRMTKTGSIRDFEIDGVDALQDDLSFCSSEGLDATNRITGIRVSNFRILGTQKSFTDLFRWNAGDMAYVDFVWSEWIWNGITNTAGAPPP